MEIMKKLTLFLLGLTMLVACKQDYAKNAANNESDKPKNIILLIGDGMGLTQLYAGYTYNQGKLNITRFPVVGIQKTNSFDDYITGSASSGTAISSGKKTNNGMIGMGPDTTRLVSILELADKNDLATGIISTSAVTHATPASFIAHQVSRHMYEEIAADFLSVDVDVVIGGGKDHFTKRKDGLDLTDSLEKMGYGIYTALEDVPLEEEKIYCFTAPGHNPKYTDNRGNMLPDATRKALDILGQDENGFFLIVEGSQIDWGGHDNNTDYIVNEVIDFDNAVGVALEYAKEKGNTLVIVTADHETGGMAINNGNIETGQVEGAFTTGGHTGVWVPVFTYGPAAIDFSGFYENTDLFVKMKKAFSF